MMSRLHSQLQDPDGFVVNQSRYECCLCLPCVHCTTGGKLYVMLLMAVAVCFAIFVQWNIVNVVCVVVALVLGVATLVGLFLLIRSLLIPFIIIQVAAILLTLACIVVSILAAIFNRSGPVEEYVVPRVPADRIIQGKDIYYTIMVFFTVLAVALFLLSLIQAFFLWILFKSYRYMSEREMTRQALIQAQVDETVAAAREEGRILGLAEAPPPPSPPEPPAKEAPRPIPYNVNVNVGQHSALY